MATAQGVGKQLAKCLDEGEEQSSAVELCGPHVAIYPAMLRCSKSALTKARGCAGKGSSAAAAKRSPRGTQGSYCFEFLK